MDVMKTCARCGDRYNELHNFGALQCNMHPSAYGPICHMCCGKAHRVSWRRRVNSFADFGFSNPEPPRPRRIKGCVRCDHGDGSDVHARTTGTPKDITLGEMWTALQKHHSTEFVEKHMLTFIQKHYPDTAVTRDTLVVRVEPHA